MADITVYVHALPGEYGYGNTDIVIPVGDAERNEFLIACRDFFRDHNRDEDADKFYQAAKQDLSDDI